MSDFNNYQVKQVSDFLQNYMIENSIEFLTADQSAGLLAKNNILSNNIGPKLGFNFRQMLRDGRDKHIKLVTGAIQERPKTKWKIYKND